MPFTPRTSLTLSLAIAGITASTGGLAASPNEHEMAWTCTMQGDGEWQCDVNDAPEPAAQPEADVASRQPQPDANAPAAAETTAAEQRQTATEQQPTEQLTSKKSEPAKIEAAPAAIAVQRPQLLRQPEPRQLSRPQLGRPQLGRPQPNRPATAPQATAAATSDSWDCHAENGDWVCQAGTPSALATGGSQPGAVQPGTPQLAGNPTEWQCEAGSDGNWDCNQQQVALPGQPLGVEGSAVAQAEAVPTGQYSHLDWITDPNAGLCRGYYLVPQFNELDAVDNPPLYLEALQSSTQLGGLTRLEGGVKVQQEQRLLSADYAEYDQVTSKASLQGDVSFREPGVLLRGDTAQADIETGETIFTNAQYVMHERHLRGEAGRIIRLQDARIRIEDGSYTYCPPGVESWQLHADNIMLDKEEGFGTARDMVLEVGSVPILYLPYVTFPIDDRRKSGFLYPSISVTGDNGLDLAVPYYFNLAANYDDTLTPRIVSERGMMLENEFRYLNRRSYNVLNTSWLSNDDKRGNNRWLLGIEHENRDTGRWDTEIDFTRVSDDDYFDDLDTTLSVARHDHLNQRGEIGYWGDGWNARLRVHGFQTISDDDSPYEVMPQFYVQGSEGWNGMQLDYFAEAVSFDRDLSGLTGADRITGERFHLMPTLSYNWRRPWGYLKPAARLWHSSYQLDDQLSGLDDQPSISVPVLSLDSGLIFERMLDNGGQQTLEPRLFMLYASEENQDEIPDFDTAELDFDYRSLFRFNRFSGRDRIGDAQQVSLGVTSRWIEPNGYERARFSIGQAYYLADREVQLSSSTPAETSGQSDIASEAVWHFNHYWRGTADLIFDEQFDSQKTNLKLSYQSDLDHRFNFSYRFEEDAREQIDSSLIWPLGRQWSLLGRWQHDIQDSENLETLLGLEYESCCWSVRFAARRWLDDTDNTDSGFYLQFYLKGLGGLGSGSGSYLDDIIGFREREEQKND
ncbi:LPS-assembly protein LptD [Marinobacterium arenosum]|uniref:LPS-assembly protein LptD n=1 Tax=Marinobacterium arenosum TaxID=2862496 RepID=UPI001C989813|nr:LPS-assembly protein LptD [Marinobacterium arenosum]MBY4676078.1 LPS-assembly protein LptD [Marinobacterium arenosum]